MKQTQLKGATRLSELDVREVSVVDRGANKKKFLIVKNLGGVTLTKEMEEIMPRSAMSAVQAQARGLKSQPISKNEDNLDVSFLDILGVSDPVEPEVVPDVKDESTTQDPIVPIEKDIKETTVKEASALVERLTSVINKVEASVEEKKDIPENTSKELLSVAKSVVGLFKDLGGELEVAKSEKIEPTVILEKVTKALENLMAFVAKLNEIEGAVEKVEDSVITELKESATILSSFIVKEEKPEKKSEPTQKAAESKEEKIEESGNIEAFIQKGTEKFDDPEILFKVGSKIKRSRLSKLQKLHELLGSLIAELAGTEKNVEKKENVQKFDEKELITKIAETITPKLDEFSSELSSKVGELTKRLDSLENLRPAGNSDSEVIVEKKEESLFGNLFSDL